MRLRDRFVKHVCDFLIGYVATPEYGEQLTLVLLLGAAEFKGMHAAFAEAAEQDDTELEDYLFECYSERLREIREDMNA